MSTATKSNRNEVRRFPAVPTNTVTVADIEIRLSPLYPWLLIVFGAIFFLLGLLIASPIAKGGSVGLGILICVASAAAIVGGNYWRHHLPVVARLTQRQLSLPGKWPRRIVVEWSEIVEIEKKTIALSRHGVRHSSEFVCIKLKNPLPSNDRLSESFPAYKRFNDALLNGIKDNLLGGYDITINPQDEFLRTADWLIAECKKRMAAIAKPV